MASGGQFNEYKIYIANETLTASNLNSSLARHKNNMDGSGCGSGLTNVAGMQATQDPGEAGSENVPVTILDWIQQLNHIIKEITGKTHAYESPGTSLEVLSSGGKNLAIGLEFEGALGGASSTTDVLAKLINQGAIINAKSLSTANVQAAAFDNSNEKFGTYGYALGNTTFDRVLAFPGYVCNPVKGSFSGWIKGLSSGDYIAYNPLLGIELYVDGSSKLAAKVTEKVATGEAVKASSTVTGNDSLNYVTDMASTYKHVGLSWALNDVDGASTDQLKLWWDGVADSDVNLTGQNLDINSGAGGNWFFGAKRNDPSWTFEWAANADLSAHSAGLTAGGSITETTSGGISTFTTTSASGYVAFDSAGNELDLNNMTVCLKLKLNSNQGGRTGTKEDRCIFQINDGTKQRGIALSFVEGAVLVAHVSGGSVGSGDFAAEVNVNTREWHQYWLKCTGTGGAGNVTWTLFIDGVNVATGENALVDATVDTMRIDCADPGASLDVSYEYIKICDTAANDPVDHNAGGYMDSIGITKTILSDALVTALQTSKITSVFGQEPNYGITLPLTTNSRVAPTNPGNVLEYIGNLGTPTFGAYVASDGISEFEFMSKFLLENNTAGATIFVEISVNGDNVGGSPQNPGHARLTNSAGVAVGIHTFSANRTEILPPGLHFISVCWSSDAGTVAGKDGGIFVARLLKDRRLG